MGSTAMDPTMMPAQEEALANYGKEEIAALANFYGYPPLGKPQHVDPDKLIGHTKASRNLSLKRNWNGRQNMNQIWKPQKLV